MNDTLDFSVEKTVGERFDEVVAGGSTRLAVAAPDGRLSYGELAAASRRIAAGVAARAAGAPRVALLCRPSSESIAALLGIARAGQAWIALDARDPVPRLARLWRDAGQPLLLGGRDDRELARAVAGERACALDDLPADGCVLSPASPGDEAYLLYTSGSTGAPKGVRQSHRNLLHHARTYARSLRLRPDDSVALVASLAVDAAVMDVFGALVTGASLHLWDTRGADIGALPEWLAANEIGVYHSTPTVFRCWARELPRARPLPGLRRIVLGGEPADRDDYALFRRITIPGAVLINGLGPSESTLALQAHFDHESDPGPGPLPIGHTVDDTEAILLPDDACTEADAGELALRSAFLALGYWNRPALERAAFLPDPDGGERRIYRTGDQVRRLADGGFAFVGRRDRRLKLAGHTVELAEIEARLRGLAGIAEAAVVASDTTGRAHLTAFVRPRSGAVVDETALLRRLRAELPRALVPARIVALEAFPLTTSGKLDRAALVAPGLPARAPRAARDGIETWTCAAFADLLGVDCADADLDFFGAGGHSLLALRLLGRIRATFAVDVPLDTLFEAATPAALAAHIATATGRGSRSDLPARPPRLPASFGQERLLFFQEMQPDDPTYHVPLLVRLRGPLDRDALVAAVGDVVARHEALRTRFQVERGEPWLDVSEDATFPVAVSTPAGPTRDERLATALSAAREHAARPFDLERGPLLRLSLFEVDTDDTLVLLTVHHIAVDGWSMRTLCMEWSTAYRHRRRNEAPSWAPAAQYPDFALWQRRLLGGPEAKRLRAYWRGRLADVPPLDLPGDRPRPAVRSRRGGCLFFALPASLAARVRRMARAHGATSYHVLLASYAALLGRHARQQDFAVASPVAGRGHPTFDDALGSFVNTLAFRCDLSGAPTVAELVTRTRRTVIDGLANADLPFDQVVSAVRPTGHPAELPLAQAMLIVHHGPAARPALDGVDAEPLELHLGVAMFDLTLTVRDDDRPLAWLEYAGDRFDEATVVRLRDRWLRLLAEMVDHPDRPLSELELVSEDERRYATHTLNVTARPYDLERSIGARIFASAAEHADATAIVHRDQRLRYDELVRWSQVVGAALVGHGVSAGDLVPVLVEPGLALVPAWLGVLAAQAAFVPLDPTWPAARVRAALARIRPRAVLVAAADVEVGAGAGPAPVDVLALRSSTTPRWEALPAPPPSAPVYGFFTSGSTGEPKLALIAHGGLANRFAWMDETFGEPPPVTLQTTPHVFDSAVWQLLWPLCRGGRAVIPHAAGALPARELVDLVEREGVTVVDFVPSVLDALLPQLEATGDRQRRLRSLRDVILGGEALAPATLHALRRALPDVRLTNLYGPTEATIGCIAARLTGDETEIPIGKPIANVCAVVLDEHQHLVPPGVPGELYLGGACLGLGYHGDEDANRRSFVPNPIPELDVTTLYRTGDRVCHRADGALRFLGRCDDQIKLRGLRIEPGEIEAALRDHPAVREAYVGTATSAAGEPELRAWVAPAPAPPDLRAFLHDRLPAALVPAQVVACPALPRLPGGKLDRSALPEPPAAPQVPIRARIATATERLIADAWQARGLATDDLARGFFDAGGSSLLALRVHFDLEQRLGRRFPLVDLFRHPTIATLAAHLDGIGPPSPPTIDLAQRARTLARRRRPR